MEDKRAAVGMAVEELEKAGEVQETPGDIREIVVVEVEEGVVLEEEEGGVSQARLFERALREEEMPAAVEEEEEEEEEVKEV